MSPPKSRLDDQDLSGTSLVTVDYESVFCSECGASYVVAPDPHREVLICPTCGPSLPIAAEDDARVWNSRRPPRRWPQLSFAWLQIATICLTFVVFLGFVMFTLGRGRGKSEPGMEPSAMGQADTQHNPSENVDGSDGSDGSIDNRLHHHQALAVASATKGPLDHQSHKSKGGAQPPNSRESNGQDFARVAAGGANRALIDYAPEALDLVHPIDDGMVVVDIIRRFPELFGKEVLLQCQVLDFREDARGKVPDHFEIDGESIMVEAEAELHFRQLEIVDTAGRVFPNVYLRYEGKLRREFDWMMPGDWVVLKATPGWRRDRVVNRHVWGLVVTDISPAQIKTDDSEAASLSLDPSLDTGRVVRRPHSESGK